MLKFGQKGDFVNVRRYLTKVKDTSKILDLNRYGNEGIIALSSATPTDTGETANSWRYQIKRQNGYISLSFYNDNIVNGVPIAIILQYGHGTRNGGWVEGRDYINPAIQPIFDEIAEKLWKEVTSI